MPLAINTPAYWEEKYQNNRAGWDTGNANPTFVQLIKKNYFLQPCKILIVGMGKGYDAVAAAKHGYEVTAIDFSESAISSAENLARQNNVKINFLIKDFFELDEKYFHQFDAVYDYVFYCAIDISKRKKYAELVSKLLKPTGKFIVILFPVEERKGGPPFGVNILEFYENFSSYLKLEFSSRIVESIKPRKGREVLQIYVK